MNPPVQKTSNKNALSWRTVLDQSPVLIAYLDPQFRFIWVNRAYAQADNREPSFFPGKNHFELYPNAENEAIFRRVVETAEPASFQAKPFEYAEHPDRGVGHWDWSLVPVKDEGGRITALMLSLLDVTDRVKALEESAASREHYRHLVESANAIPWEMDPATWRFTYVGPQAVNTLGYPVDAWSLPDFWVDHLYPDDREDAIRTCKEATEACQDHDLEYRMLAADGRVVWIRDTVQVVCDETGATLLQGFMFDVTEHKRTEAALRERDELLRSVVTNAPIVLFALDRHGVFTLSDGKALEALGMRPGDVVGRSVFEVYTNSPQVLENMRRALAGDSFVADVGVGERIYESYHKPMFGAQGEVTSVIGMAVDVTERRRAERALEESERKYRELVNEAATIILRWDTDGNVTFFNEFAQQFFGYLEEEILGRNVVGTIVPEQEFTGRDLAMLMKEICRDPTKFEYNENENVKRSGERVWIAWKNKPIFDRRGKLVEVLSVGIDITRRKWAEEALRESQERFMAQYRNIPIPTFTWHKAGDDFMLVDCNEAAREITDGRAIDFIGLPASEMYPDAPEVRQQMTECLARNRPVHVETSLRLGPTDQLRDMDITYVPAAGDLVMVHAQDITERRRAEAQIRQHASALRQTADSVTITDQNGIIEFVNSAFERTTGYRSQEAVGKKTNIIKSGMHAADFYVRLWETILAGNVFSDVMINRRKDGSLYYEEKTITPLKDAQGHITHFIATGKDISERMQTQERLQYLAHHDVLTGLPNRMLFTDRLDHALALTRGKDRTVALLFLDLDRFKMINDTLGHAAGDRALQVVAERLQHCVRKGDTVARLGGDEFAVILEDSDVDEHVAPIARKVLEATSQPLALDSQEYIITASIGISIFPHDGEDSATLLKNADIAMYRAKDKGRDAYQFYSSDMGVKAFERLNLETSLRRALARKEFVLNYQPQVDATTGQIIGVEALLRWQHPELGLVAPEDFIPILEETGLIVPVGEWVLHTACAQAASWQSCAKTPLRVAVNLSPRQFHASNLKDTLARVLADSGLAAELLEVEVTESFIIQHSANIMDAFLGLDAMGVRLALDDFGTGYSSLSYLKRFPVDVIKIDRSFVRDIPSDPDDAAIVRAIIAMAASLKLQVIAEGVETEEQLAFLREQNCTLCQGFLFSRPVPAEDLAVLLSRGLELHSAQ